MAASIQASGAGVQFIFDRQQRVVTPALARLRRHGVTAWGLRDLDFTVPAGSGVALLGPSGSGKTTLLRLIAGVLSPDVGRLDVDGRVGSLLSIEAGLHWLLTGRENAELLGVLAGMSRAESRAALEAIKHATRLEDAFERPVLSYSEGMRARLGFTVANHTEPEILLLDEVHEALDHSFREIVAEQAREILRRGGIVMAAGHDHPLLQSICDRALLLDGGRMTAEGSFAEVRRAYIGPSDG